MKGNLTAPGRWENYVLAQPSTFASFWQDLLASGTRDLCFISGLGFDPRMCLGAEAILALGGNGRRTCLALDYREPSAGSNATALQVTRNRERLGQLFPSNSLSVQPIPKRSPEGRRIASPEVNRVIGGLEPFLDFTDIIVDISALPRDIFLTLIAKLIFLLDERTRSTGATLPNLHVIVAESAAHDRTITVGGIDDSVTFIKAFSGHHDMEATASVPRVWIPVLGEGRESHLRKIFDTVQPDEVAPLIPWPSRDPRRGDELVGQYREVLFDVLRVEPRNIIYAAERNPFQAYREIRKTIAHYSQALQVLGGCKAFVSPLSSKLLSVGALLACYELRFDENIPVGIPHLAGEGHSLEAPADDLPKADLFSLWITGECYSAQT